MKKLTVLLLCVFVLPAALAGCRAEAAAAVPPAIYGEYTLLKTLDINGNVKVPEYGVLSLTIKESNTYELVLYENGSQNRYSSTGSMSLGTNNDDLSMYGGLADREWQFELRDDRNDYEPSDFFVLDVRDDGSICLLWIPQGVGDNSWLEGADFWFLERISQPK